MECATEIRRLSRRSQEKSHNPKPFCPFDFGFLSRRGLRQPPNPVPIRCSPYGAVMGSDLGKRKSRRTEMSFDKATGRWCAKLGRKKTKSGKTDGHKFRFTEDLKESERRKLRIQQLWDRLVEQRGPGYTWSGHRTWLWPWRWPRGSARFRSRSSNWPRRRAVGRGHNRLLWRNSTTARSRLLRRN